MLYTYIYIYVYIYIYIYSLKNYSWVGVGEYVYTFFFIRKTLIRKLASKTQKPFKNVKKISSHQISPLQFLITMIFLKALENLQN